MHWRQLIEGCDLYRQQARPQYDAAYQEYMGKYGANLLPAPQAFDRNRAQDLIDLANKFGARMHMEPTQLAASYQRVHGSLSTLASLRLESAALDQPLGTGETASDLAEEVFDSVAKCAQSEYSAGTSKMLHALLPQFFVMWDNAIAAGYASPMSGHGYAFTFLPRVLKELEEAIVTYGRKYLATKSEAAAALAKLGGDRPLSKLLDEFNYAKYTLSVNELWDRV